MIVVEILLLSGAVVFGLFATISDFKYGRIPNKAIIFALAYAITLDIIYYGIYANDIIVDFIGSSSKNV